MACREEEKALYGVYWLVESVRQSAVRSFKVGVHEKKSPKNEYKLLNNKSDDALISSLIDFKICK